MINERRQLNQIGLEGVRLEPVNDFFRQTAEMLLFLDAIYDQANPTHEQLKQWNQQWYGEIVGKAYDSSYANPTACVTAFGEDYGPIYSFLYAQMRSGFTNAVAKRLFPLVIDNELFLEIYQMFRHGEESPEKIKAVIYDHMRDYSQDLISHRVRQQLDPTLDFATRIVMGADFTTTDYLYAYGEYVSDNEIQTAKYLSSLPKETLVNLARTYVDGFHNGFIVNRVDMSKKRTVNIRYHLGFEPVIRESIRLFGEIGLSPILYPWDSHCLLRGRGKIGYLSTSPNPQYDDDHRQDDALFWRHQLLQHKLECYRNAYEAMKEEASVLAGPACMETFGEKAFTPKKVDGALSYSKKQQKLNVEFGQKYQDLVNEYILPEERSFTIIAYPIPEIGENFTDIFEQVMEVNQLDQDKYRKIQQVLIDALDEGVEVHIKGKGDNRTDLYVALREKQHPEKETNFENCLADVNIPVGEVFTSPKLRGTNGILNVSSVFLGGVDYKDLTLTFTDGMVSDYHCQTMEDEEDNKGLIQEKLLYHQQSLPMGEFAIGTNTTAYTMAKKYDILHQLPILIVEKMGPHFAIGDTCYSHCEEVKVYNPDGKEIIARDNECSIKGEYFQCHTDITIPYEEIESITVIGLGGVETPLIEDGRFVLPGSESLNEALTDID